MLYSAINTIQQKNPLLREDFSYFSLAPISRILYPDIKSKDSNLSRPAITDKLKRFSLRPRSESTILHRGKNLAVSPWCFHQTIPCGILAFRHWRLCSHLCIATCGCYPLPFPSLTEFAVFGLSSLRLAP